LDQPGGGTSKKVCTLNVKVIDLVHPVRDLRFAFQGDFNVPGLRQSRLFGLKVVFLLLFFSCGRL